jgi:ubiquinone/menaquinone biosynthesis C-methylase UbiE
MAIADLDPKPGDTVIELGCGTGLNFDLIQERIGPTGTLIGVDITPAMLERTARRVAHRGWKNVELIESDLADLEYSARIDHVISTFALTLSPDYARAIRRARQALSPGGSFVILDLKAPAGAGPLLIRLAALMARPFAVTPDLASRHPWEVVEREFSISSFRNLYLGFCYIATGRIGSDATFRITERETAQTRTED